MENLVPLGTGNSRLMKSNIPASTTLAQLIQMWNNGTFPYDIGPLNSAGISQQGTPLNKDTLLKDATAALFGLPNTAVPDDVLSLLAFGKARLVYEEITQSKTWTAPETLLGNKVFAFLSGGGGGEGTLPDRSGGGSGYISISEVSISPGQQVTAVVGAAGAQGAAGGTTSFGSSSAAGGNPGNGYNGGNGNAGGGAGYNRSAGAGGNGGNGGIYGGGGGGCYGAGGNGGTYGGGGGGGMGFGSNPTGGTGGEYGGNGGTGSNGSPNYAGATAGQTSSATTFLFDPILALLNLFFSMQAKKSKGGNANKGGGGGAGFFSAGADGGKGSACPGGGGGGYFGNGGPAEDFQGGGGGGLFCNATDSGGGGFGPSAYGKGGGYDTGANSGVVALLYFIFEEESA